MMNLKAALLLAIITTLWSQYDAAEVLQYGDTCTNYYDPCETGTRCKYGTCKCHGPYKEAGNSTCTFGCPDGDQLIKNGNKGTFKCDEYIAERGTGICMVLNIDSTCCASCKNAETGNPEWPYGDQRLKVATDKWVTCAWYMGTYGTGQCSRSGLKYKCLETCGKAKTGNPDCPFGDRKRIYSHRDENGDVVTMDCAEYIETKASKGKGICLNEEFKPFCCSTCGKYLDEDKECLKKDACPAGWTQRGTSCYKFYADKTNYADAQAKCQEDGATLAMPKTQELLDDVVAVRNAVPSMEFLWIGLDDLENEGSFYWNDNSTSPATGLDAMWLPGNPSGDGDCVELRKPDQFNDLPCNYQMYQKARICQKAATVCVL